MGKKFVPPVREAGFFITKDEKAELIDQGTELEVKKVEHRISPFGKGPEGQDVYQFVLTVVLDDDERGISYNDGVSSRDELLFALKEHLEDSDGDPVVVKLEQVKSKAGRPVNIITVVGDDSE